LCVEKFDKCLSCKPVSNRSHHPVDFTCLCNPGFYDNNIDICDACDPTCVTCAVAKTQCLDCRLADNRQLIANSCVCLYNFIPDPDPLKIPCIACDKTCKKCDVTDPKKCLECYDSHFRSLVGGLC
jgi:hypothetical protein